MTREEAIQAYVDRFGGFPYYLIMGAEEQYVVDIVETALTTGVEIQAVPGRVY